MRRNPWLLTISEVYRVENGCELEAMCLGRTHLGRKLEKVDPQPLRPVRRTANETGTLLFDSSGPKA
jgi:hypothetical protein